MLTKKEQGCRRTQVVVVWTLAGVACLMSGCSDAFEVLAPPPKIMVTADYHKAPPAADVQKKNDATETTDFPNEEPLPEDTTDTSYFTHVPPTTSAPSSAVANHLEKAPQPQPKSATPPSSDPSPHLKNVAPTTPKKNLPLASLIKGPSGGEPAPAAQVQTSPPAPKTDPASAPTPAPAANGQRPAVIMEAVSEVGPSQPPYPEAVSATTVTPAPPTDTLPATTIALESGQTVAPAITAVKINDAPLRAETLSQPVANQSSPAPMQKKPQTITELIGDLEKLIAKDPGNTKAQLALRCLYAAAGQQDKALTPISDVPDEQQAVAMALAKAVLLTTPSQDTPADPEKANQAMEALQELTNKVATQADLKIKNLKICQKVEGFGRYTVMPQAQLATGDLQRPLVYFELENFKCQLNGEGLYITNLRAWMTLYDNRYTVMAQRVDDVTDLPSFNQRKDFFLRGAFDIPQLPPGQYRLEVKVEDKVAGKIARPAYIEFEVVSKETSPPKTVGNSTPAKPKKTK